MCEIRCDGLTIAFSVLVIMLVNNVVGQINEELVKELYNMYRDALRSEHSSSLRRLLKNDREYNIHVQRLKEVNGFKKHNLLIKEVLRSDSNPIIYINNPVESKLPNAFLSLNEFKRIITERVEKERDDFYKVTVNRNPSKSTLSKKVTKSLKYTSVTNNMYLNKDKHEHRTESFATFATTKPNKAKTMQTNSKTQEIKSKTLLVVPLGTTVLLRTDKPKSTKISTLETNANNLNSILSDIAETSLANTTLEHIIHKNTLMLNTLSLYSTTDNSTEKHVINVTESYSKELKASKLEENKDEISETKTTTVDESTHDSSVSSTLKLTTDKQLKVDRSRNMTTTELAAQEETKSEISIISAQTTTPTTTKSKRRTLGRPRVFIGR